MDYGLWRENQRTREPKKQRKYERVEQAERERGNGQGDWNSGKRKDERESDRSQTGIQEYRNIGAQYKIAYSIQQIIG